MIKNGYTYKIITENEFTKGNEDIILKTIKNEYG